MFNDYDLMGLELSECVFSLQSNQTASQTAGGQTNRVNLSDGFWVGNYKTGLLPRSTAIEVSGVLTELQENTSQVFKARDVLATSTGLGRFVSYELNGVRRLFKKGHIAWSPNLTSPAQVNEIGASAWCYMRLVDFNVSWSDEARFGQITFSGQQTLRAN